MSTRFSSPQRAVSSRVSPDRAQNFSSSVIWMYIGTPSVCWSHRQRSNGTRWEVWSGPDGPRPE